MDDEYEYEYMVFLSKEAEDRFNNASEAVQKATKSILKQAMRDAELEIMLKIKEKEKDFTVPSIPC